MNPSPIDVSTIQPPACVMCGTPIQKPRRGPTGKTCSHACRTALHRQSHPDIVVMYLSDGAMRYGRIAQTTDLADAVGAGPRSAQRPVDDGLVDWMPGHGDLHNVAFEQCLRIVEQMAEVFDGADERRRIGEAVQRWIRPRRERSLSQADVLRLYAALNPVLTELKGKAADVQP